VTQPDHSARRRSTARTTSTHPAPTHPDRRRGGSRRPWPTAPTTTRVSPAKPASSGGHSRSRGSASTPTPATVWTAGTAPIALDATWSAALVERVVTSFTEPGARVLLLEWPTPNHGPSTLTAVGADGVIDRTRGTEPVPELRDAVTLVQRLDRTARVEHVPVDPTVTGPASRPFRAELVAGPTHSLAVLPAAPETTAEPTAPDSIAADADAADLIVTSVPPLHCGDHCGDHDGDHVADLVALYAARRLRVGGILAVLTHCDWTTGELTDPTGRVVAAGQNADLLYLQHIVAVHAPVRDGRFQLHERHPDAAHAADSDGVPNDVDSGGDGGEGVARARHRAQVRGLPEPHRRIHSDVLVFAQPHDHQPSPPAPTSAPTNAAPNAASNGASNAASTGGDLR